MTDQIHSIPDRLRVSEHYEGLSRAQRYAAQYEITCCVRRSLSLRRRHGGFLSNPNLNVNFCFEKRTAWTCYLLRHELISSPDGGHDAD